MSEALVREAVASDWPEIERCHRELEAKLGKSMDLPKLDDKAILNYWVVELDGAIIGGFYRERVVEQCHFGLDPRATAAIREFLPQVDQLSQRAGVRFVHVLVPQCLDTAADVGRHLEQSDYQSRDEMKLYVRDLR